MEVAVRPKRSFGVYLGIGGALLSMLPVIMALILIMAVAGAGSQATTEDSAGYSTITGNQNLSPNCERYRSIVEKYANQYGLSAFVDVIMAVMMQESGGDSERYPDIMQSSEYAGWARNTIKDPETSIDYGVQAIRDALQVAGCTSPTQIDLLKLALQGYNFGSGYVSWALSNYGGYSKENALEFSNMMAGIMGWNLYGDPLYVDHVLQYLTFDLSASGDYSGGFTSEGIDPDVVKQLEILMENWPDMDEKRGAVISKGATLIGKTSYAHNGAGSRTGADTPAYEDCSSFVAWAFQKCGFTDVPYASVTGDFLSDPFYSISQDELMPGDIGLKNSIYAGNDNHVGIYVGRDQNGNQMWLHCSSYGNSGPRIDYYSNFRIYYRYKGFKD